MSDDHATRNAVDVMQGAIHEIEQLRRRIRQLEPEARAYRAMLTVIELIPPPRESASIDMCWALNRAIHELNPEQPAAAAAGE